MGDLRLCGKQSESQRTIVEIGNTAVGSAFTVIAGPCSVESEDQMVETAIAVKAAGATLLRGGAYKPRTSPYSFQGLGLEGLRILHMAGKLTGLPVVTEVVDANDLDQVCRYADVVQIGTRNMQNYALLRAVGQARRPVLLKRGMQSTIAEWLLSAEYILAEGNPNVILCERGIRTFETATRNTLDLSAVAAAAEQTHLPILVDPSHGTGVASLVAPMSMAAMAAGAAGLMVEVHPNPAVALSDGSQSLTPDQFYAMMRRLNVLRSCIEQIDDRAVPAPKSRKVMAAAPACA